MDKHILEEIINEGPQAIEEISGLEVVGVMSIFALKVVLTGMAVILGMKAGVAHAKHKEIKGRQKRECGNLIGPDKKRCKLKVTVDFHKQVLNTLNSAKSQCNKSSNPEKCNKWIERHIVKVRQSLIAAEGKYKEAVSYR